jgi:hypothetical protein
VLCEPLLDLDLFGLCGLCDVELFLECAYLISDVVADYLLNALVLDLLLCL